MDSFLVNSVINNSRENGGKGWGEIVNGLPIDGTPIDKLSTEIAKIFEINYESPRKSCLKKSDSSAKFTAEIKNGGVGR